MTEHKESNIKNFLSFKITPVFFFQTFNYLKHNHEYFLFVSAFSLISTACVVVVFLILTTDNITNILIQISDFLYTEQQWLLASLDH